MSDRGGESTFHRVVVAVETDAARYYGPEATRPRMLNSAQAEQLLAHLATDIRALLPGVEECSLIAAGALYDQTQLLRPGFPVFEALEAVASGDDKAGFRPALVSVGTREGRMPDPALEPRTDIPLSMLLLLPLTMHGPAGAISSLGQATEYRFLEEGQVSAHTANWLQSAFGVSVTHARFMTLTDLNALLRIQLDHFGFLPLWELLDAALSGRSEPLTVTSACGQVLEWRDGAVHTAFETFDHWATQGLGKSLPAPRQALAGGYSDWTREIRQYASTLKAHGLELRFFDPDGGAELTGTFFVQRSTEQPDKSAAAITEHSFGDMGTIAITATAQVRIDHYYPLQPRGLNDIHALLRERAPSGLSLAFPGTILYSERTRKLIPDGSGQDSAWCDRPRIDA